MARKIERTLHYGDVEETVKAFYWFWEDYSRKEHEFCQHFGVSIKLVQDTSAPPEYRIMCDWYAEGDPVNGAVSEACARLRFRSLPNGKQKLIYQIYEPSFDEISLIEWIPALTASNLERIFSLFLDYLRDEGYIGEELTITKDEDGVGDGQPVNIEQLLSNVSTMRQYYKGYSSATAKEIIEAAPKAAKLFDKEGGRWGPGMFEPYCSVTSTTIGRYLGAFRKAGLGEIAGLEEMEEGFKIKIPGPGIREPY